MDRVGQYIQSMPETVKAPMDSAAVTAVLLGWLNVLSLGLTIVSTFAGLVWIGIRIYETKTVQEWLKKRRAK